jgi:hypothetical protein
MPGEGPCLVRGWVHTLESTLFRANGGPALEPPREYPQHWIRSCSTKRVEDLKIGLRGNAFCPHIVNIKNPGQAGFEFILFVLDAFLAIFQCFFER